MRSYRGLSVRACRLTSYAQTGRTVTKLVFWTDFNSTKTPTCDLNISCARTGHRTSSMFASLSGYAGLYLGQIAKVKSASSYLPA